MARAPQKINSYIVIDFETGGLDKKDGLHSQKYPITEFAGMALNGVTLEEIVRYDNLVKPYDDKLTYDPEAARFTSIDRQMCEKDGVELKELVADICSLCEQANIHNSKTARPIIVGHNIDFDRGFLQDIFRRCKVDMSKYVDGERDAFGNFIPHTIDTIDLAKACWADITETTTKFKLANCCERAGLDLVDGHHAMNDVVPTADLLRYLFAKLRSGTSQVAISDNSNVVLKNRQQFQW